MVGWVIYKVDVILNKGMEKKRFYNFVRNENLENWVGLDLRL